MNKIFKLAKGTLLVAVTLVAMVLATGSAMAFGEEGYRGFSIGIIANDTEFTTQGREEERGLALGKNTATDFNATKVTRDFKFPSLFLEYSYGAGYGGVTIGLEHIPGTHSIGAKARTDVAVAAAQGGAENDTGTRTARAEVKNMTTFYVEPALMANDYIGVYAKGGLTVGDLKTIETTKTATYGDADIFGGMYGIGIKAVSPWGLFIKLERTETYFKTIKLESTTSSSNNRVVAKPKAEQVRLAIGMNF